MLRLLSESSWPPLIVVTTPGDTLLYEEDLVFERALKESGREHAFRIYESRGNPLGHVFNVLFPEYEESLEANRDIAEFFFHVTEQRKEGTAE